MTNIVGFFANYTKGGVSAAPSSTPTITVYRINRATGVESLAQASTNMTASSLTGRYYYYLTTADIQTYDYHARCTTSDTTVDRRDLDAVQLKWSEATLTDSSGQVTVGSLASGVVTASAVAAGALNGKGDWATAAAILTTALTESYAAAGAAPTLSQLLFLVQQRLTNFAVSGTSITVKKLDGTTQAAVLTTDSSTAPTSSNRTS